MKITPTALVAITSSVSAQLANYAVECDRATNFLSARTGNGNGCWLQWSGWSECHGTCGKGVKVATRKCRGNEGFAIPDVTAGCGGSAIRRRPCTGSSVSATDGSNCAYYSFWSEWGACVANEADYCSQDRFFGRVRRSRKCNDPEAKALGMAPRCSPDPTTGSGTEEYRNCNIDRNLAVDIPSLPNLNLQYSSNANDIWNYGQWGPCSVTCGTGKQSMTITHKCANYPNTWVPEESWYRVVYRTCGAQTNPGEVSPCCPTALEGPFGTPNPCRDWTATWRRSVGANCGPEVETQTMPPSAPPTECKFDNEEDGWGGCMPQPAPWNDRMLTTCGGNGVQIRTCTNVCAKECAYGDTECKWLQTPWSFRQERSCGPPMKEEIQVQCDLTGCRGPTCRRVKFCDNYGYGSFYNSNQAQVTDVIECPPIFEDGSLISDKCPASKPSCCLPGQDCTGLNIIPCQPINQCGCGATEQIYRTSHCGETSEVTVPCPEQTETCYFEQWRASEALSRAMSLRKCVCASSEDHLEQRFQMCQTIASTGEICSRYQKGVESRVSAYAKNQCLSPIQRSTCPPMKCLMPGQMMPMYQEFQSDYCLSTTSQVAVGESRPCYASLPPCCAWSAWSVDACPVSDGLICPSQASMRTRRRINSCADQFPDDVSYQVEIETTNIKCPVACPRWPDFGPWSECSNILEDGTHCGGYRSRVRDYPCRQDVYDGLCRPSSWYNREVDYDPFTDLDTVDTKYHSEQCWAQMQQDTSRVMCSEWSTYAFDSCGWNRQAVYKRTRTCVDKCTGDERVEVDTETRAPLPCLNQPDVALGCQYSSDGCSATVTYKCIAQDPCSGDITQTRVAGENECPAQPGPVPQPRRSVCQPTSETYLTESCIGMATQSGIADVCKGTGYSQQVECQLPSRWSDWSEFDNQEIIESWTPVTNDYYATSRYYYSPYARTNVRYSLDADMTKCNVCGGQLVSIRRQLCGDSSVEYRVVNCPTPVWSWSSWSGCESCSDAVVSENRYCERTRSLITRPEAMNCGRPEYQLDAAPVQSERVPLPPCSRKSYTYQKFCKHPQDASATCGQGIVHMRQTITEVDNKNGQVIGTPLITEIPYDANVPIGRATTVDILSLDSTQKSINTVCNLQYQVIALAGEWSPCDNECGDGTQVQIVRYACREPGRYAFDEEPRAAESRTQTCRNPTIPQADLSEWTATSGSCLSQCETMRKERRTCVRGRFRDPENSLPFGGILGYRSAWGSVYNVDHCRCGNCCEKDPASALVAPNVEERDAPCPFREIRNICILEKVDPLCQCGTCAMVEVCTDPCTGSEVSRSPAPAMELPERAIVSQWSMCKYEEDVCQRAETLEYFGWRERSISNECIEGRFTISPRVETQRFDDCRVVLTRQTQSGTCYRPYGTDQCDRPTRTDTIRTICNNRVIDTATVDMSHLCEYVAPTALWSAWSACSVECGYGSQSRQMIDPCAREVDGSQMILDTETRACGCPESVWSDWSEPQAPEDICVPCGPAAQYTTSVRTCLHPKQEEYGSYADIATRAPYGYYGFTRSTVGSSCFAKCNRCTGSASQRIAFNASTIAGCSGQVTTTIFPEICPECPMPGQVQIQKTLQCGRVIDEQRLPCAAAMEVPRIERSPCSVPCGQGTRSVTRYYKCSPPQTETETCQGIYGEPIISPEPASWSKCIKAGYIPSNRDSIENWTVDNLETVTCGGGIQIKDTWTVCSLRPEIKVRRTTESATCADVPCHYWNGWTDWGLCSVTCGSGVQQRFRQCVGARPQPFGGPVSCEGSSVDAQPCDMGDCCEFPWSGWSNCCMDQQNRERKRLKWRGYNNANSASCLGSKEFEELVEPCGSYQIEVPDSQLRTCSSLKNIARGPYESLTTVEITPMSYSWVDFDSRVIPDGKYRTNNGWSYEVINGQWFRNVGFSRVEVTVQQAYSQGGFIYKLGGTWYRLNNGVLYPTTYIQPIETYNVENMYSFGYAQSGRYTIEGNQFEVFMNNDKPEWRVYNDDGSVSAIEIEDKYNQGIWYYNFGSGTWYRFRNGDFEPTLPTWVQNGQPLIEDIVTITVVEPAVRYGFGW